MRYYPVSHMRSLPTPHCQDTPGYISAGTQAVLPDIGLGTVSGRSKEVADMAVGRTVE